MLSRKRVAKKPTTSKKTGPKNRKKDSGPKKSSQAEAKAVLAKMQAKKDAGDCPFC